MIIENLPAPKGTLIESDKRVFFWQEIYTFPAGQLTQFKIEPPLDEGITEYDIRRAELRIGYGKYGDLLEGVVKADFGGGSVDIGWICKIRLCGRDEVMFDIGSNGYVQRVGEKPFLPLGVPMELWLRLNNTNTVDTIVGVFYEYFTI